jgi:hypothetical protein
MRDFDDCTDTEDVDLDTLAAREEDGIDVYYMCGGCDFPHLSEQQAANCCPPKPMWVCPTCGRLVDSYDGARYCCT